MNEKLKTALEKEYGIKNIDSIELIKKGVSNLNYKVTDGDKSYVARVCRFEPENQLQVMLPFLLFAEKSNLPAARLTKTLHGELSIKIDNDPVVVTTFIQGSVLKPEEINESNIESLAESVAKLHSIDWQPKTNSKTLHPSFILNIYKEWQGQFHSEENSLPEQLKDSLEKDYITFSNNDFLSRFSNLPQRVVHGDLIPGNVMFGENDSVAAIVDFEEVGTSTRLLDLARIVTTWFFVNGNLNTDYMNNFMKSYNKIDPLNTEEKNMFDQVVHYVTFRHAVFIVRMLLQGRLDSIEDNNEIAAYLSCVEKQNFFSSKQEYI